MPLHVSNTVVLVIRRSKFYYTASGIITPVGDRPVHRLKEITPVGDRPVYTGRQGSHFRWPSGVHR